MTTLRIGPVLLLFAALAGCDREPHAQTTPESPEEAAPLPEPPQPPPSKHALIARSGNFTGDVTLVRWGKLVPLASGTELQREDILRVPDQGEAEVVFDDEARVRVTGPATLRIGELSEKGRRVLLAQGVIKEAAALGIPVEIQTPADSSIVLQNCTGAVEVVPGERVVFRRLSDGSALVWNEADKKFDALTDRERVIDLKGAKRNK